MPAPRLDARTDIPALTGLRGVAALWVFFFHLRDLSQSPLIDRPIEWLGGAGYLGVDVFFVLSGFVLAWNYADAELHVSTRAWGAFLWKRLARIYPAHVGALALFGISLLVLMALDVPSSALKHVSIDGLLRSLLLVQAWQIPAPYVWNLVAWSISCEWAAYLCFPLIAALASRLRSPPAIAALLVALFSSLAYTIVSLPEYTPLGLGIPRIAVEFTAGVLTCRLFVLARLSPVSSERLAVVALVLMIAGGNLWAILESRLAPLPWVAGLACLIVFGLAGAKGTLAASLSGPRWQYAGRVSYCFYLVHWLVVRALFDALAYYDLRNDAGWTALAIVAACAGAWALAHWLHRSIELPARRAMLASTSSRALAIQPGGASPRD